LAFLTPLLIWIQEMLSWHWVFIVTGGIGIIWSLIWFKVYQPPRLTKGISKAELDYIRDGGGLVGVLMMMYVLFGGMLATTWVQI
ncbi:hypothetical protein RI705_32080, partial [Pseudomonas aeruginosa]